MLLEHLRDLSHLRDKNGKGRGKGGINMVELWYGEVSAHVGVVVSRSELGGVGRMLVQPMDSCNFRGELPRFGLD